MESLLIELIQEQRQTNQLLTELNDNFLSFLNAMAEEGADPDALPPTDMDGNPI